MMELKSLDKLTGIFWCVIVHLPGKVLVLMLKSRLLAIWGPAALCVSLPFHVQDVTLSVNLGRASWL